MDGNTLGLETTHRAKLSKYFSLYARPRFEVLIPKDEINDVNIDAQQLYGKWAYKNFKIEVGRDSLIWGQGEYGGLILSNNARPMDMVSLGTDSPFILPWFLKYLGPTSFKVFFANLGSRSDFNNIILSGYKWSILPVSFFELGLNHVVMMGGDGTTGPGFFEAIGEFTGFLSAATGNKRITNIFTNRLFSVEGRLTLPPLR
ncbi:MAG: hypothetical protein HY073_00470, partial [Deltaproteobacteria bacterium]|nr:hypothetical protein [Deltaproteobacteria bacterium]